MSQEATATPAGIDALAHRYIDALNAPTWEALRDAVTPMLSPNINFQEPSAVGTHEGRDKFLEILKINKDAFPDMVWKIEASYTNTDSVAINWSGVGIHSGTYVLGGLAIPPSGRRFSIGGFAVLTYENDVVVKFRGHPDKYGLMLQLGILMVPPTSQPV